MRTGQVMAIMAGDLYLGELKGGADGAGTFQIQSRSKSDTSCRGEFIAGGDKGGAGSMICSDGATAKLQYQRLTLVRGYGTGSGTSGITRGGMSFTYGLNAEDSRPYLRLPAGKSIRTVGKELMLIDTVRADAAGSRSTPAVPGVDVAPDVLLSTATEIVIANLKQERSIGAGGPGRFVQLVETTILPLFAFVHMTQLAVARNWSAASADQKTALVAEFRTLLVRTYSSALANYQDQAIEYKPLRPVPGETEVTVRSYVKKTRSERMTIDYDMERTPEGWKVYDIKIAGISLITNYRSNFAQIIADDGIEGLIAALAAKNRLGDNGASSKEDGARPMLFMLSVIPSVIRGNR